MSPTDRLLTRTWAKDTLDGESNARWHLLYNAWYRPAGSVRPCNLNTNIRAYVGQGNAALSSAGKGVRGVDDGAWL
ncbi:hypothetical protein BaRGS_00037369, partial [Batillaria attramentaria]